MRTVQRPPCRGIEIGSDRAWLYREPDMHLGRRTPSSHWPKLAPSVWV